MKLKTIVDEEYANVHADVIANLQHDSKIVDELLKRFDDWVKLFEETFPKKSKGGFSWTGIRCAKKIISSFGAYTSSDISSFLILLKSREHEYPHISDSGLFISALINKNYNKNKSKERYTIPVLHFDKKIDFLCYENNGATVYITGSVGSHTCMRMRYGKVIIDGDAGFDLGEQMQGGIIYLKGINEPASVGDLMTGGTIYIDKGPVCVSRRRKSGKIFEKNEQTGKYILR